MDARAVRPPPTGGHGHVLQEDDDGRLLLQPRVPGGGRLPDLQHVDGGPLQTRPSRGRRPHCPGAESPPARPGQWRRPTQWPP